MKKIIVVPLSTGGEELLTSAAAKALEEAEKLLLRTRRHPIERYLTEKGISWESLDALYDECEDFDIFNRAAVIRLLEMSADRTVYYGVADPAMDSTVATLMRLKPPDIQVEVLPGVSHADRCLAMLQPQNANVRLCAASQFLATRISPETPLLLCELHSRECAGDCKLKLLELLPPETSVDFFEGDEQGRLSKHTISLCELDRQKTYDHMTAAYTPGLSILSRRRFDMDDLTEIMTRLRGPEGCPWDREQTHESLLPNLLEESYEFIAAVREQETDHMADELGDVLLQVVFHAEMARQHGEFTLYDVTSAICQKMMERHTHIFGDAKADTAGQVLDNWETIKRVKRGLASTGAAMQDVSTGLSSLMRAWKVQQKAARVGFDFRTPEEALAKVREETKEVLANLKNAADPEEELGDLLFAVVNVCRLCEKNPDIALFLATNKFISRFVAMEEIIKNEGKCMEDLTLSEMDVYWFSEKQRE